MLREQAVFHLDTDKIHMESEKDLVRVVHSTTGFLNNGLSYRIIPGISKMLSFLLTSSSLSNKSLIPESERQTLKHGPFPATANAIVPTH